VTRGAGLGSAASSASTVLMRAGAAAAIVFPVSELLVLARTTSAKQWPSWVCSSGLTPGRWKTRARPVTSFSLSRARSGWWVSSVIRQRTLDTWSHLATSTASCCCREAREAAGSSTLSSRLSSEPRPHRASSGTMSKDMLPSSARRKQLATSASNSYILSSARSHKSTSKQVTSSLISILLECRTGFPLNCLVRQLLFILCHRLWADRMDEWRPLENSSYLFLLDLIK